MTAEDNKLTLRRFVEAIDRKDVATLDRFVSTSYVDHNPLPMPGMASGLEGLKQAFVAFLAAFPDSTHTIEDLLADGDKVVARVVGRGTHQSEFMGVPPSGRQVTMEGIAIYRFENGKIAEKWGQQDRLGIMQQLGIVPKNANDPPAATTTVPNPASQPHGTTQDQVNEMESEGQATKQGQRPNPSPPVAQVTQMPGQKDEKRNTT